MATGASTSADERRAMELRQAVHRLVEQVRARMLEAVPARVVGRIAQPEVRTLVDDRGPARDAGRGEVRGRPMGKCQEHRIHRRQLVMDGQPGRAQVRVDAGDRVVVALAALQPDELDVRVAGKQPDELRADVSGGPDDPDPDPPGTAGRVDAALRSWEEP